MPSSDSESEGEKERLRLAVDPSFTVNPINREEKTEEQKPKSSRRKVLETEWDSGHYQTVKLTPEGQAFLSKRLANALTENIKFVRPKVKDKMDEGEDPDSGIYLFSDSTQVVTGRDLAENASAMNNGTNQGKRKKPKLKRRKLEDEGESDNEDEKLKSVAVSADWVTNQF